MPDPAPPADGELALRGAGPRLGLLWVGITGWGGGYLALHGAPTAGELVVALSISAVVGSILNLVNWVAPSGTRPSRVLWGMRVLANFAVPFAVSLTSNALQGGAS